MCDFEHFLKSLFLRHPYCFFYDFEYRKLQNHQSVSAMFEYQLGFYVFFERTTKSTATSGPPLFEQNGPGEAPLFTARLGVTTPPQLHFNYSKPLLPHASEPTARRIDYH